MTTGGGEVRTVLMTADTIGGVWTYSLELAAQLAQRGISTVLATMGEPLSPSQWAETRALPSVRVEQSRYRLEWMDDPWEDVDAAGAWLSALAQEVRPDVVHLNGYVHGSLAWGVPVVVVAHSCVLSWWEAVKGEWAPESYRTYQQRVRQGIEAADAVVAPTAAMLHGLGRHYGAVSRTHVIWNGRDLPARDAFVKEPFIFSAGRFGDAAKNLQTLGRAAAGLPWPVRVAGRLEDPSGRQPLPLSVKPLGQLSAAEMREQFVRAAIYCLPARYEPFGLSILEAAGAGCALVLGDIPTLRELWEGAAVFVPPDDAPALHAALQTLIADSSRREELGQAARTRAARYTPEKQAAAYVQLYRELLVRSSASPPLSA